MLLTAQIRVENIWFGVWCVESKWRAISAVLSGVGKFQHVIEAWLSDVESLESETDLPARWQRQRRNVDMMETTTHFNKIKRKVYIHDCSWSKSSKEMTITGIPICNTNSWNNRVSHTHSVLTAIIPGEPQLASCPLNSPSPFTAHPFGTGINFPCHS